MCRWASKLQGFRDTMEHLPGEDNLWGDMLSRWISKPSKARTMALRALIAPLLERDFSWPSIFEIQLRQVQSSPGSLKITSCGGVLMFMDKTRVNASNLRLRICIVGHCGVCGHLSFEGTKRRISEYFLWESFEEDIKCFCGTCIPSMTNHLSLDRWERKYTELHRTKLFITTFFIFSRGSSEATSRSNTFW